METRDYNINNLVYRVTRDAETHQILQNNDANFFQEYIANTKMCVCENFVYATTINGLCVCDVWPEFGRCSKQPDNADQGCFNKSKD